MRSAARIGLLLTFAFTVFADSLPTVVVLATGGTIASRHNPVKGGYEPALRANRLLAQPEITGVCYSRH